MKGTPMKRPPSVGRKNVASLDIGSYTQRGEFRVGMALNLPLPPVCLQYEKRKRNWERGKELALSLPLPLSPSSPFSLLPPAPPSLIPLYFL